MASNKSLKKIKYLLSFLPDKVYIQLYYFAQFKRFCNFKNPKTYNEKLQWLKLHDRNPMYTKIVDKYEAKEYVSSIIGDEYIIPTLGVWDCVDEIDINTLPDQFVLKCTHDSEGVVICKNKSEFDFESTKQLLNKCLKNNFYYIGREWPYKNIKPRVIAEEYMEDSIYGELRDYKFFCFNGEPKVMFIASNRSNGDVRFDYYDLKFNHLNIRQKYNHSDIRIDKPVNFNKMIELSRILSKNFSHLRVDFYEVNGKVYFGELTFYHFSGFMPFEPGDWDMKFGDWIKLPENMRKS